MMLALIVAHGLAAGAAPFATRWLGRRVFVLMAVVPAVSFGWLLWRAPQVTGAGATEIGEYHPWIPVLDVELGLRLTTLSWVLAMLVTGVGAAVLVYCAAYFRRGDTEIWRFSAVFTGFAGAMLGLVLSDDLVVMYVFWELTTVASYLLVGHNPDRAANRRAATTALVVTTFGGLAMLVGVIVIGHLQGSYRLSELVADPPEGTLAGWAVALLAVGALSKSALVPFHFWLPGAMAAPTPVSAYLHAAAMVKAGVYLVAVLAPAVAGMAGWREVMVTLGVVTMLVGALRALRQYDIKLLLAYGTVSQLGFLVAVVGVGTRSAALAGVGLVVAHALFKSTLFLVVGIVDRATGTRDLRELTGLGRRMPLVAVAAVLAGLSMAGVPPLLGFLSKEAVFVAFLDIASEGDGTGFSPLFGYAALTGLVVGSALTVGYTARFLWGAFADKAGVGAPEDRQEVHPGLVASPVVLALACLALGFAGPSATEVFSPYTDLFAPGVHEPELTLWHGLSPALGLSVAAIVAGLLLFASRRRVADVLPRWPRALDAERVYRSLMRGIDRLAVEVTGATQRGSLPIYLGVIALAIVLLPGGALVVNSTWPDEVRLADSPIQAAVVVLTCAAAVLAVRSRRRLRAVIIAGVAGYGTAVLFVLHGAPDLALTQTLVETVTLAVFVLVLRRLPPYFTDRPLRTGRWWRIGIGAAVGTTVASIAYAAAGARTSTPTSAGFEDAAVSYGYGKNIVNVTLVDIRAWDTIGELSVVVVAATGVASLIFLITGRTTRVRPGRAIEAGRASLPPRPEHVRSWLPAGPTLEDDRRSLLFEVITRLIFHAVILFSLYLVFAGHNAPGGGFAGGLMAGLALMVRYLAGGRHELDEAAPVDAGQVLGLGLLIAALAGLAPLLVGGTVLESYDSYVTLPLLGELHLVTALVFDVGVYLVVVGLMLDVVRSLGGGIDAHAEDENPAEAVATR